MALIAEVRELVRQGDAGKAEVALSSLLAEGRLTLAEMGTIAIDLFQMACYPLAAMVFAKWTELDPANPEPWSNLGLCLLRQRQPDGARQVLEFALELDATCVAARSNLCDVYKELGLHRQQLENALECVKLEPTSALIRNNLGTALLDAGKPTEARSAFIDSLRLNPEFFEARFNLARLDSDEGNHEAAVTFYTQVLANDALDPRRRELIEHHLSFEYLGAGKLAEGWTLYERGFSPLVPLSLARRPDRRFAVPCWDGMPLQAGQTLLLWREQGIGDELRFLSLLSQVDIGRGQLIIETDRRLVAALQRSYPHMLVRAQPQSTSDAAIEGYTDFDVQLPIGSLPRLFMKERASFHQLGGYLKADPSQVARFAQRLAAYDGKIKIGICWRSHLRSASRNRKYTALADWGPVLTMPDAVFVNLQYGDCEDEIAALEQQLGITIIRWSDVDLMQDIEAVLAIIQLLDLVVSPSTAVLPMAGAIGTDTIFVGHPTWMLLGETECYPWFRTVIPLLVPDKAPVSDAIPRVPAEIRRISHRRRI